jgi:TolB-like protein
MQPGKEPVAVRFGPFRLDLKAGELHKNGRKIRLQEQPFKILTALLERQGEIVTREELQSLLWPDGTNVDFDKSINSAVKRLRDVLNDNVEKPKYVETVARRGYRMPLIRYFDDSPAKPPAVGLLRQVEITPPIPEIRADKAPTGEITDRPSEETEARVRGSRFWQVPTVSMVAVGMAAIGLFVWIQIFRKPLRQRITSVAVLPFEDLSGDQEQTFFADGMTEELIGNLGKISGLRVISRTSAMAYRNTKKTLGEIARQLHAIIEGTVLHSGDRVRITAHLIQESPEGQLWTESYHRDLQDVMILQDELAREIAYQIRLELSPSEKRRLANARPVNPKAHEAYLKGRYLLGQRTDTGIKKSVDFFQEAIDADSHFALAYAGMADSHLLLASYGLLPPNHAYPKAEELATKSLELDDTLAEPHTALGFARSFYDCDWTAASREFRRAIDLNPNYPPLTSGTGSTWRTLGSRSTPFPSLGMLVSSIRCRCS